MELRDLFRETKSLAPGTLARANVAFLLEEGRLRHETGKFNIQATRLVDKQEEQDVLVADIWRRRVYTIERRDRKPGPISIGRTKQCDITIELSSVSSQHATIEKVGKGLWTVTDGKSKNGTVVNGTALKPGEAVPLRSGMVVSFGKEVRLTFLDGAAMEHALKQLDPVLQRASAAPLPPRPEEALPSETPANELPTAAAAKKDPFAAALSALVRSKPSGEQPTVGAPPPPPPPPPPPGTRPTSQFNATQIVAPGAASASTTTPSPPTVRPASPMNVLPRKDERPISISCSPFPPVGILTGVPVVIGRSVGCDLILPHPNVSRRHACFERAGDEIFVSDMGSGNGVWVGKQKITAKTPVPIGQPVGIGPYKVLVAAESAPAPVIELDNSTRLEIDP